MSEVTSTPMEGAPQRSSGLGLRGLYEVFYRPAAFFTELKEQPKILVPYLVILVFSAITMWLLGELIVESQLADPNVQERLAQSGVTINDTMRGLMKIQTLIFGTISMLVTPLLAAALALLVGNFIFAGKATFRQLLSIVLYSEVIYHVGSIIVAPLMLMKNSFVSPFSLSVLVADRSLSDPLFVALSRVEVFLIWEIIAAGIGFTILYNVARSRGITISLLSIGSLSALFVLWTMIMSAM